MAERRTHPNGGVYERGPDGRWHLVSSPAIGPAIGNNPRLPLQMQSDALGNANAATDVRVNQATEAAQIREANAKAVKAEEEAVTARKEGLNPAFDREKELRSAFEAQPAVQAYKDAATSLGIMLKTPDTGGGDIQIIYNYIKSQGPGPVAQGELDLAQSVASFRESLEQKYGKITSSNRLPPRVRRELIEASRQAVAVKRAQFDQVYTQFRSDAVRNGLNAESVTGRHPADAIRPSEEKYIRDHGGQPQSRFRSNELEVVQDPNDPNAIPEIILHQENHPDSPLQQRINETDAFGSGLMGAADAMTFGLADEAAAGLNAFGGALTGQGSFGDLYRSNLSDERSYQDALRERDPLASFTGNVLGSIGGLGATSGLLRNAGRLAPLATRGGGIGADMLYGAGYGAGAGDENRLGGAALGAGAAAGGNLLGRHVVAPAFRGGAAKLGFNPAPPLPAGQGMIANQAMRANPDEVLGRLNEAASLNMPLTLADAAPQLRSLGGSVVRKSPDAFALAREAIGARPAGQADRLTTLIGDQLAPPAAIGEVVESSLKRARAGSKDLYGQAMGHAPPDDPVLNELLRTPAGEQAARNAYSRALNSGEKPADLSFEVDSITQQPRLVGNPNWRTLQYMKFELDDMATRDGTLKPLARRFNTRLSRLNDDFRKANKAYGDIARQGSAAQAGYDAAAPGVSPANLGLPKDNLSFFQQGFASRMADTAGKMRLRGDPYEAVYGSPWQQTKLGQVFPEGAPNFAKARDIEGEMSLTNRELFGGSPTQPRAESDKMFEGGAMDTAVDAGLDLLQGTPPITAFRSKLLGARAGAGGLRDWWRLGSGNRAKEKADQLAPMLFNPNPEEAAAALADMIRQQALRDAYVQRTGMFGSAIGTPTAISLTNR